MKHLKKLATTLNKNCLSFIATLALFVTYNGVNTACWFVMNQDELPKGSKKLRNFQMNALSTVIINKLLKDNLITKQNQDLYLYGLNGFILLFVNLLTSLLLGYFTNHLLEIIMFLILFIPLRSNAGGFHTKKKLTCYCFSNLMLLAIVYIPNLIISKTAYGIIAILFVLSNLLILCLAPIPNFNRIFDPSEKIVFKRRTHYVLLIEFCFVIFTSFFNFDYWSKLYMLVPIVVAFLLIIDFLTNKMRHLF